MSQVRQGFLAHDKVVRMAHSPPASGVGLSLGTNKNQYQAVERHIETNVRLN